MTDDLKKRFRDHNVFDYADWDAVIDRIEELEAALRRISHAPHGKVFNAIGHEEAYLIACAALENKND